MFLAGKTVVVAQVTCDCSASVTGSQNFSTLTWTGTGCPTALSTFYIGNLCVNIPKDGNLIMDKNFTVDGGFGISTDPSPPTLFTLPSGITLNVTGHMGDDSNNNTSFVINGTLNVGGTLYGKNGNGFSGNGTVNAGGINLGNGASCGDPCNIDWNVPPSNCSDGNANFCENVILPISLLFFNATSYPDYVELNWATASELNFDRFVIEKTRDGETYVEIGSRQGAGVSTSRIDYSFKDDQVLLGRTYYRLKAIDFDGFTEYFGLVSVSYDGVDVISVFPNPAPSGAININFNYYSEDPIFYKVMNVSGAEGSFGCHSTNRA